MNINSDNFDFSLDFDEKIVNLSINGENRDKVFLLYSELKDYISNDVCTQRIIIKDTKDFFFMLMYLCRIVPNFLLWHVKSNLQGNLVVTLYF